jgi:hypothetical protein
MGAVFLSSSQNEREQSAVGRTRDACSDEAGDQPCDRPASPYGAPLRRLTNPGAPLPFGPGLAAFATPGGFKERALDAVLRLEAPPRPPGIVVASHNRRRRSPSTLSTPAEHPCGERGCAQDNMFQISVNINFIITVIARVGGRSRLLEGHTASEVPPLQLDAPLSRGMTTTSLGSKRGCLPQHIGLPQRRMDSAIYFRLFLPGWPMMAISPMT